ncbi:MAG: hypothetical protein RLZZ480_855 [Candidatus Parcubacteria bacterium]|jgi:hypothetical protein
MKRFEQAAVAAIVVTKLFLNTFARPSVELFYLTVTVVSFITVRLD